MLPTWNRWFSASSSVRDAISRCSQHQDFASVISKHGDEFDQTCVALLIRQLGKSRLPPKLLLPPILQHVSRLEFAPRYLSNCIYGIAAGNLAPKVPVELVHKLASADVSRFNPQDFANTLWAFGNRAQPLDDEARQSLARLCQGIRSSSSSTLAKFNAQDLSNSVWALAKLSSSKNDDDELALMLQRLAEEAVLHDDRRQYKPQELANVLWGLADAPSGNAHKHFAGQVEARVGEFNAQELTNVAWAYATTTSTADEDNDHEALWVAIGKEIASARPSLHAFNNQALSNLCWAFATVGHNDHVLWTRLEKEIVARRASSYNPQALATIMWAFAQQQQQQQQQQQYNKQFWDFAYAACDATGLTGRDWTTALWAFAKARRMPPSCCLPAARLGLTTTPLLPKDVVNLVYAMAVLNLAQEDGGLLLLQRIASGIQLHKLDTKALLNVLWAFACMDKLHLLAEAGGEVQELTLDISHGKWESAWQLYLVGLCWQQQKDVVAWPVLDSLLERYGAWAAKEVLKDTHQHQSRVQLDLLRVVRHVLGKPTVVQHEARVLGGLSVDMLVPQLGLVIEVDGPVHFLHHGYQQQQQQQPTGDTLFKRRLLERAGFRVVSLSTHEYKLRSKGGGDAGTHWVEQQLKKQ